MPTGINSTLIVGTTSGNVSFPLLTKKHSGASTDNPVSVVNNTYINLTSPYLHITKNDHSCDSDLSNPFVIRYQGSVNPLYAAIPNDNQYHDYVVLNNGTKFQIKKNGSAPGADGYLNITNGSVTISAYLSMRNENNTAFITPYSYDDMYCFAFIDIPSDGSTYTQPNNISGQHFNALISGAIVPLYSWKAWTILQGNSGQYRQRLTALKDDSIGDISSANYGTQSDFISIAPNVDMVPYARNMNYNSPVKVAWSGINWMTMELVPLQGALTNQVRALFKLYAATSSDTVPIYSETRDFFVGSTNHFYLSFVHDDTEQVAAFLPVYYTVGSTGTPFSWGNASPSASDMLLIWQWLQASGSPDPDPQPERPYDNGTTDNGGGGGNPTPQDDIHTPNVPTLGAMASGMFTVYCPTDAQLQQIAAYLWSDNFIDNVKKYFNSVSDNIIAFYVLPLEPDNLQTKNFKIGNLENVSITGVKYLSDRFVDVEMGSIGIERRWGTYLDFSPFTKFSLYLPGVGVVALDSDDVMSPPNLDGYLSDEVGSTISLSYTIDLFTGTLVAYVYINGQIRYQFPGRMGYSIPLTGQNYTAMGTGFVQAMAGLAATIATGGTAAPFTAGATAAGIVNAMKPDVYRAGNLSGDASMLSLKTPMLIKTVPNVPAHEGLEDFIGGPSYKIDTIGSFSGFTQAIEAHIEGISCTSAERDEIMQLLKSGVII